MNQPECKLISIGERIEHEILNYLNNFSQFDETNPPVLVFPPIFSKLIMKYIKYQAALYNLACIYLTDETASTITIVCRKQHLKDVYQERYEELFSYNEDDTERVDPVHLSNYLDVTVSTVARKNVRQQLGLPLNSKFILYPENRHRQQNLTQKYELYKPRKGSGFLSAATGDRIPVNQPPLVKTPVFVHPILLYVSEPKMYPYNEFEPQFEYIPEEYAYNEDTYHENTYNEVTYNEDMYNEVPYSEDTFSEVTYNEVMYNEDIYNEITYTEDTCNEFIYNEDTYNEVMYNEDTFNENTYNEVICNEDTYNENVLTPYEKEYGAYMLDRSHEGEYPLCNVENVQELHICLDSEPSTENSLESLVTESISSVTNLDTYTKDMDLDTSSWNLLEEKAESYKSETINKSQIEALKFEPSLEEMDIKSDTSELDSSDRRMCAIIEVKTIVNEILDELIQDVALSSHQDIETDKEFSEKLTDTNLPKTSRESKKQPQNKTKVQKEFQKDSSYRHPHKKAGKKQKRIRKKNRGEHLYDSENDTKNIYIDIDLSKFLSPSPQPSASTAHTSPSPKYDIFEDPKYQSLLERFVDTSSILINSVTEEKQKAFFDNQPPFIEALYNRFQNKTDKTIDIKKKTSLEDVEGTPEKTSSANANFQTVSDDLLDVVAQMLQVNEIIGGPPEKQLLKPSTDGSQLIQVKDVYNNSKSKLKGDVEQNEPSENESKVNAPQSKKKVIKRKGKFSPFADEEQLLKSCQNQLPTDTGASLNAEKPDTTQIIRQNIELESQPRKTREVKTRKKDKKKNTGTTYDESEGILVKHDTKMKRASSKHNDENEPQMRDSLVSPKVERELEGPYSPSSTRRWEDKAFNITKRCNSPIPAEDSKNTKVSDTCDQAERKPDTTENTSIITEQQNIDEKDTSPKKSRRSKKNLKKQNQNAAAAAASINEALTKDKNKILSKSAPDIIELAKQKQDASTMTDRNFPKTYRDSSVNTSFEEYGPLDFGLSDISEKIKFIIVREYLNN